jgi:LytS/YehU family sensor histidine kinase
MVPTYFIALYMVPKFLAPDKILQFVIVLVLVALFVLYARIHWIGLINLMDFNEYYKAPVSKVLKNVIRDYSVIALAVCIYIIADWRAKKKVIQQLAEDKARIEIALLKSQLHPHFLFNTLNNIYSLAIKGSEKTADSILKLSSLLDYLVYQTNRDRIPIQSEIALIQNYLELEKLRYGDALQLQLNIQNLEETVTAPPLIILPFVENCFKHGGKNEHGIFEIRIDLKLQTDTLHFTVVNSIREERSDKDKNRVGIGLKNIRDRLNHHYPGKFTLDVKTQTEYFVVELLIELR